MSDLDDFKKKAMSDPALQAELSALAGKSRNAVIGGLSAIASRHGFTLSESEIATAMDRQLGHATARDLDDAELDRVAAGDGFTSCQPAYCGVQTVRY